MADHTKIEWTDATWNPITGCSVATPGCTNCYAMKLAGTRMKTHPSRAGLTIDTKAGPVWNGEVRFNEQWLTQPLQWKKPRMIFVCAHADLFHENVPDEWIDRVFAVMALAPQHTFQLLTKRSKRMREYLCTRGGDWMLRWPDANPPGSLPISRHEQRLAMKGAGWPDAKLRPTFPLPNVWLGVSVEDQKRADERIPDLLATPAAVRWISAEPLLGPVELNRATVKVSPGVELPVEWEPPLCHLDWVVVGGESGANARPMHPDWARSLRDQCAAAGVPFMFKQHGEFVEIDGVRCTGHHGSRRDYKDAFWLGRDGSIDRDIAQGNRLGRSVWGQDSIMKRVGKKAAGRLLDGVEHNGYPEPR